MATKPENQKTSRPSRNVNNIYDRLEEARARRAEAMALKPAANNTASAQHAPAKTSTRVTSKAHFPEIVMPPPEEPTSSTDQPAQYHPRLAGLVAVLISTTALAIFVLSSANDGPAASLNLELSPSPEGIAIATPPTAQNDAMPLRVPPTPPLQSAQPSSPAQAEAFLPRPRVANMRTPFDAPDDTILIASPAQEVSFLPQDFVSAVFTPATDFPAALDQPVSLTVSVNIPITANRSEVGAITRALDNSGHQINDPRRVRFQVRNTQVRYFHQSDATSAGQLADDVSGTLRDFTDFRPSPPKGFVEVFVAGSSPVRRPPETSRGLVSDLQELRNNLTNALRSVTR